MRGGCIGKLHVGAMPITSTALAVASTAVTVVTMVAVIICAI